LHARTAWGDARLGRSSKRELRIDPAEQEGIDMNGNGQKLALVPIADMVASAEQLLVYETAAAKILKISVRDFRRLVDQSVIPYRLHRGRSRRLFFVDDLKVYARNLTARSGIKQPV
jgi:hypothetical protein